MFIVKHYELDVMDNNLPFSVFWSSKNSPRMKKIEFILRELLTENSLVTDPDGIEIEKEHDTISIFRKRHMTYEKLLKEKGSISFKVVDEKRYTSISFGISTTKESLVFEYHTLDNDTPLGMSAASYSLMHQQKFKNIVDGYLRRLSVSLEEERVAFQKKEEINKP